MAFRIKLMDTSLLFMKLLIWNKILCGKNVTATSRGGKQIALKTSANMFSLSLFTAVIYNLI